MLEWMALAKICYTGFLPETPTQTREGGKLDTLVRALAKCVLRGGRLLVQRP